MLLAETFVPVATCAQNINATFSKLLTPCLTATAVPPLDSSSDPWTADDIQFEADGSLRSVSGSLDNQSKTQVISLFFVVVARAHGSEFSEPLRPRSPRQDGRRPIGITTNSDRCRRPIPFRTSGNARPKSWLSPRRTAVATTSEPGYGTLWQWQQCQRHAKNTGGRSNGRS